MINSNDNQNPEKGNSAKPNEYDYLLLDSVSTINEDLKKLIFGVSSEQSAPQPSAEDKDKILRQNLSPVEKAEKSPRTAIEKLRVDVTLDFAPKKGAEKAFGVNVGKSPRSPAGPFSYLNSPFLSPSFSSSPSPRDFYQIRSKAADENGEGSGKSPLDTLGQFLDGFPTSPIAPIGTPKAKTSMQQLEIAKSRMACDFQPGQYYSSDSLKQYGFLINTHLVKTAAADRAGISVGDIFIKFGEFQKDNFSGLNALANYVRSKSGAEIPVIVLRSECLGGAAGLKCFHFNIRPFASRDVNGGGVIGAVINVWPLPKPFDD